MYPGDFIAMQSAFNTPFYTSLSMTRGYEHLRSAGQRCADLETSELNGTAKW